jgi:polyketide synthase PksN
MTVEEILTALREKRVTPEEARRLLRKQGTQAPAPTLGANSPTPSDHSPPTPTPIPVPIPTAIAIVGMSGRYATASNLDEYWQMLDEGRSGVREIPPSRWDMDRYYDPTVGREGSIYCRWMGILDDADCFDSYFFEVSPSEAEMMDPQHRIFLEEAYRAFEDAGYTRQSLDGSNCGVYLGMSNGGYQTLVHAQAAGRPSVTSSSDAIAAGRLAYYLNLKGPALTIDTACSSSLVGVHLAVQALQGGEIDMALAGGVSLYLTPEGYMHMCAAGMLSPDGQCKTFDNGADGFVAGEGAGAVVLKRLADAERDGDHVYGLISASGINQDGKTNGITAPNLGSQTDLVKAAYERYGIDPRTISYAELHGTGTKLGDPIELEALATAFRAWTDRRGYCAIASVKSNVGHMSAAAGVAGLHKVLLSMRHRTLAPTLHVRTPNEHFDFEGSPFYINTESRAWEQPADGGPRRACLSSFGFSGTNAHVVIDEYVPAVSVAAAPRAAARPDRERAFLLSAKTAPQLAQRARQLAAYLAAHPEADLDDVAYTLRHGREAMRERLAILAREVGGLTEALERLDGPGVHRGTAPAGRPKGRAAEAGSLREAARLWAGGTPVTWPEQQDEPGRRIPLPTYPFEKQRHWYTLGDTDPDPVIAAAAAALHPLVHQNVSDFTRQRFRSLFTGEEFFLADHRVDGDAVLPGAAVVEMARAAGELSAGRAVSEIRDVVWSRPITTTSVGIGLLPAADGATADFEVEADGALCASGRLAYAPARPVAPQPLDLAAIRERCATRLDPAANLYADGGAVTYGPAFRTVRELSHSATEALARLHLVNLGAGDEAFALHPAILDGAWQAIAPLLNEARLPFAVDRIRCFAPLSATAYAHVRANGPSTFDVTITDPNGAVAAEITGFTVRAKAKADAKADAEEPVFLTRRWEETTATQDEAGVAGTPTLVVFADTGPLGSGVRDACADGPLIEAAAGDDFTVDDSGTRFTLRPDVEADHARLLAELRRRDLLLDRIIIVSASPNERDLYAVHALARALADSTPRWPMDLLYLYAVTGRRPDPLHHAMGGYLRCLAKEDSFLKAVGTLGIRASSPQAVADRLREELATSSEPEVWWDGETRKALRTAEITEEEAAADGPPVFRTGGVYLITGGLGGLGLVFARYLRATYQARLVLTGRREPDDAMRAQLAEPGADALYIPADVSRRADVSALIARAKDRFGRIDGVIHSAGTLRDAFIRNKSADDLAAVLAPKVAGTQHLDEALRDEPLDCFVLFSSMSAVLGNAGQSDYCFANAYQDGFARAREQLRREGRRSGRTLSIGWPLWTGGGGMTIEPEAAAQLRQRLGVAGLGAEEGCRAPGGAPPPAPPPSSPPVTRSRT